MYDTNEPIVSSKLTIMEFLKSLPELDYIDIIENHPDIDIFPIEKPLISFGRSKVTGEEVAFNSYLGEKYDEVSQQTTERTGKLIRIYFDMHLWNSTAKNKGGEREIERLEGKLIRIFEFKGLPDNISYVSFESGDIDLDPDVDVFHCRCVLSVEVLIYEDVTEDAIEDINVKGSVVNE